MIHIQPHILKGQHVQLEPLQLTHKDELYDIAQNEAIWTYNGSNALGDNFNPWFEKAISNPEHLTFVIRQLQTNKIVGSTRFYNISPEHNRVTIGYTWLIPEVWGTRVNPESKLLLLTFAFEGCSVNRVEFMTDSRNLRSQAAIMRLGAVQEGVLRKHMILKDGHVRNTVVFSIINTEWADVKSALLNRIS